jgi:hypothetical protein
MLLALSLIAIVVIRPGKLGRRRRRRRRRRVVRDNPYRSAVCSISFQFLLPESHIVKMLLALSLIAIVVIRPGKLWRRRMRRK